MVLITGHSGRFPASESFSDFWQKLCDGVDLVTECPERYPAGYSGLPSRQAQCGGVDKFDAMFFGISSAQADSLDPQIRLLLEVVFEAISDAGYTMEDLARTNTGVYVGGCFSDMHKALLRDVRMVNGYENTGCSHSMFANRVSFCFDFTGPSLTIDTACSSSLVALDIAARDIRSGKVDRAVVAGVSIAMDPAVTKSFNSYGMLSPDGKCHSFDDRANGYVRADGVGAVLLESPSLGAGRGIVSLLGSGSNSDGTKPKGITFPASGQQIALCKSVCEEYDLDPSAVVYVEAHGTGTTAGDGQELMTLDSVYGKDSGILIGSVKSNMGHSEGASGMMSLLKVLGIITEGIIPTNLHYEGTTVHRPILNGRLKVVDTTQPLPLSSTSEQQRQRVISINNFGFGGTNAHVVCAPGERELVNDESHTRYIFSRTEKGLHSYFKHGNLNKAAWDLHMRHSAVNNKFPYRGIVIPQAGESGEGAEPHAHFSLNTARIPPERPRVAFCYTGQGCQWEGMAKELWLGQEKHSEVFRSTIVAATVGLPVDVQDLLSTGDKWLNKQWSGFGITLVQLGLTAILNEAGVVPDYIFGHSVGEVACGYADGCTSSQEAARIAFVRCQLSEKITAQGLMLVIGMDYDSAMVLIKPYSDTVIACHNSPDGVTLSGSTDEIMEIAMILKSKGVFAKVVPTDGMAYHSKFFKENSSVIEQILSEVITEPPVRRSSKWLSTSCEDCRTGCDHVCALYPNAQYHTNNITGQVNFEPIVRSLPKGVVIVEVGPHSLLKSIIKRCRAAEDDDSTVMLGAMRKDSNSIHDVTSLLDALWLEGVRFEFPKVNHMVPVRHRINMEWDHDDTWRAPTFADFDSGSGGGSTMKVSFDLAGRDSFLMDHVIDGHALLPATAHVYCAWMAYGTENIHFVDVKILAAVLLDGENLTLSVATDDKHWKIYHEDRLVSQGTMAAEYQIPSRLTQPSSLSQATSQDGDDCGEGEMNWVDKETVYARFARFGYEYGANFQVIEKRSLDFRQVKLGSACHWISYLDNVLQAFLEDPEGLSLPTAIGTVSILCKDVQHASRVLVQNTDLHSFGNSDVVIRDLKTSVMRKVHKTPTIRGVEFVSYGEHEVSHMSSTFRSEVLSYLAVSGESGCVLSSACTVDVETCIESLRDAFNTPEREEFDNVIPQYDRDMYSDNEVLSCAWCTEGLSIISQILRENISRSYSVQSVGDSSVPVDDLFRILDPLMEREVDSRKYKPIEALSELAGGPAVDVAVVTNALYASTNMSAALHEICSGGLNAGGFLILREHIGSLPHLLWGDRMSVPEDSRQHGRWVTKDDILKLVRMAGLEVVIWYVDEANTQIVLLARKPVSEDPSHSQAVITSREDVSHTPSVLCTKDYGHLGFVRSLRKEPSYNDVSLALTLTPSPGGSERSPLSPTRLPFHVESDGVIGGIHEVPLRSCNAGKSGLTRGYHLRVLKPGDLESLTWVGNDEEPTCEVKFCGMNFKDVMLSYGKLASNDASGQVKIGLEFSGLACGSGRPVMGIAAGCMATHVRASYHLLWAVPSSLTLEQACTIPVVYSTVYYALVLKANIRSGQTVLIHSIAGGVGQAAFHVCKHRGVKVIATCSVAKREWVHKELGIEKHLILDSHGVAFRDDVLSLTHGEGVDVVLNSLSGEKLQASLDCVGQYGHFCEIGKYDIQQNMQIGMGIFERNVSIHGFDLSDMFSKPRLWQPVRDLLSEGLESGEVQPLCLTVFEDPEQALRHVSTGKHIGKVVVKLPAADASSGLPATGISKHLQTFHTHGAHLVIGGLGGFGFELVAYLQARGAGRIIIVSRSEPKPFQRRLLGVDVTVAHVNLKDAELCDSFLQTECRDVVGIWHLGMVLNDCLYDKMSVEAWEETVSTKAQICKNLDTSSRMHCNGLEHFVMWSSVSALFGNPGQTNYAYANSAMEGVCMSRRAAGLPGVAIQWGFIGSVGVLAKNQATNASLGFCPQHIDSCLESLSTILSSDQAVVSCYIRQAADSDSGESGAKTLTTSQRVARVLGLDPSKINSTDILSNLGMDSLQSVEIANVLKMAGLVKALDDLRFMTWTEIVGLDCI